MSATLSLIDINWSGGRCTVGPLLQSCQQVRHSTEYQAQRCASRRSASADDSLQMSLSEQQQQQ